MSSTTCLKKSPALIAYVHARCFDLKFFTIFTSKYSIKKLDSLSNSFSRGVTLKIGAKRITVVKDLSYRKVTQHLKKYCKMSRISGRICLVCIYPPSSHFCLFVCFSVFVSNWFTQSCHRPLKRRLLLLLWLFFFKQKVQKSYAFQV